MKGVCREGKRKNLALLFSVLSILALAPPLGAASSGMYSRLVARGQTVPWVKTQAVGNTVTLDAMQVGAIGDGFIILREPCMISETIRVEAYARVRTMESAEVTGTLAVDANSCLYIRNARVYVYGDSRGHIWPIVPKAINELSDRWWTKIDVTLPGPERQVQQIGSRQLMSMESSSAYNPDITPIARIKQMPDGTNVEVRNKWVSFMWWWGDSSNGYNEVFWVEEADKSAGIKVINDQWLSGLQDTLISFTATLDTMEGQRVLTQLENVSNTSQTSYFAAPPPWGMPCKTVGGPPLGIDQNFSGLDNTGRMIVSWGSVVSYSNLSSMAYLKIDDGSNIPVRVEVPGVNYSSSIIGAYKRVTGMSDTIYRTNDINPDGLSNMPDGYVRRIVTRGDSDVVTPGSTSTSTPLGTVSGHLIANETPADPVRVYSASGWTRVEPDQWQLVGSQYKAAYSVSGVPGDTYHVGLISAKGLGYTSGYVFATPDSTNVDISLTDTSVRRLDLTDPDPATIGCGDSSQITAHLYDAEGWDYVGKSVQFTATNGQFTGELSQVSVDTDDSGLATVSVSTTNGSDVTVTASAVGIQSQKTVRVSKERLSLWSSAALGDLGINSTATVYAKLWDASGQVMPNKTIYFTAVSGGGVSPTSYSTNSEGLAQTTFTRASGNPVVSATYTNDCGWEISQVIDAAAGSSWPMFQHDIAHTGVTQAAIPSNLTVKWYKDLAGDNSGTLWSSPVVADGWVYVGTNNSQGTENVKHSETAPVFN